MRSIQTGFPLRDTHEISRARSTPRGRTAEDSHPSSPRIHRDLLVAAYENACTSPPAEWIEKISSLSHAHTSIRGRVSEWIFSPCALNDRALRRQSPINIACINDKTKLWKLYIKNWFSLLLDKFFETSNWNWRTFNLIEEPPYHSQGLEGKKRKERLLQEREGEKFLSRFLLTSFICREGDIYIYTEHVLNRIKFNKKEGRGIVFHDFLRYPSIPVPWAWNKNGPVNGGNISYNSMCPHGLLI